MEYYNLDLQTGDVILFRTKTTLNPLTWVAPIIRFFTKYPYNHVGVFVSNWEVGFINEAVETGIKNVLAQERLKDSQIMVLRRKIDVNEKEFAIKANNFLGHTGYDFISLVYQAIYQTTGKWIGRTKEEAKKRMYCSEYVAYLHNMPDWWLYSPNMLDNKYFKLIYAGKVN